MYAPSNTSAFSQFISEFGPKDLPVYMIKPNREYELVTLQDLLPHSFSREETEKYLLGA